MIVNKAYEDYSTMLKLLEASANQVHEITGDLIQAREQRAGACTDTEKTVADASIARNTTDLHKAMESLKEQIPNYDKFQ